MFAILMVHSKNKEILSEDLINELNRRLSTGPAYASYPLWLATLIKCYIKEECLITETQLSNIIQAAVNNPNINNNHFTGSYILMVASSYVIRTGNYNNALHLAIAADQLTPSHVIFMRHIIKLALASHDFTTAKQWIQKFEKLPQSKLFCKELNSLKKQLPK